MFTTILNIKDVIYIHIIYIYIQKEIEKESEREGKTDTQTERQADRQTEIMYAQKLSFQVSYTFN